MRRALALVTLTAVALVPACANGVSRRPVATTVGPATTSSSTASTSSTAAARPTTSAPRPPTTPAPSAQATGVGAKMMEIVDPTRPTVDHGRTLSTSRHLPTIVRYPAVGPVGANETAGAPVAAGTWPLVVFAHGYDVTPATYAHLLHAWAAAGFVVAAPAFPLETAGGPLDENDLSNEPADISVVITAVLKDPVLAAHVQPSHIAVTGHSDGAEAALGAGFVSRDTRIGPVISMAAQGVDGMPNRNPAHPLLVVQGTQDTINPPARSDGVYAAAGPPRFYLHLLGAGHLPPVADDTPWRPIVEQVTIDFLRRYLGGNVSVALLESDATHAGLSTLTADP